LTAQNRTDGGRGFGAHVAWFGWRANGDERLAAGASAPAAWKAFGPPNDENETDQVGLGNGDTADRAATAAQTGAGGRRAGRRGGGMALTSALLALLAAAGAAFATGAAYVAGEGGPDALERERRQVSLVMAVESGDVATTRKLIAQGANPNAPLSDNNGNANDSTLLRVAIAIEGGDRKRAALVDTLLTARALPDLPSGAIRNTPLMAAAFQGDPSVTRLLLLRGARPDHRDAKGRTPLTWLAKGRAARRDHAETPSLDAARALLVAQTGLGDGASQAATSPAASPVASVHPRDLLGAGDALLIAASHGDTALVSLLLTENENAPILSPTLCRRAARLVQKRGDHAMAHRLRVRASLITAL